MHSGYLLRLRIQVIHSGDPFRLFIHSADRRSLGVNLWSLNLADGRSNNGQLTDNSGKLADSSGYPECVKKTTTANELFKIIKIMKLISLSRS